MICLYEGLEDFEHALLEEFVRVFSMIPPKEMRSEKLHLATVLWEWFSQVTGDYNQTFFDDEEALDIKTNLSKA
jgi:hypothetical protein